ncbi:MAG: hypothetical protein R6U63_02540 [Longimicrobiales bacterium]
MKSARHGLWVGVIVALVMAVVPVSAQEADPRLERIRAELPREAMEQIEARIAAARAEGLPTEPLLDKAVEGIAKHVPAPRIAGAIDRLAQELGRARTLLEDGVPPAPTDVAAVADAMRRGVPDPAIERVAERAGPGEPVALAVHTLGDLMDRGVPVEQAVAVMEAWRGRGARREELQDLPDAVDRLMRQGVLPGQAAAAVANAMRGGPPGPGQGPAGGQPPGMIMQGAPPIPPGSGPPSGRGKGSGNPGGGHDEGPPGGGI